MSDIEFTFRPIVKWPREQTPAGKRKKSPFGIGLDRTYRYLRCELAHLKAENPVVIQIAVTEEDIRLDGLPRSSANPLFPGVILSFRSAKLGPMEYSCDACREFTDNVRAICLTLERLRLIDLYGCTSRKEQYTGWRALPNALVTPAPMNLGEAAQFIYSASRLKGAMTMERIVKDNEAFRECFRAAALRLHPDANGGSHHPEWGRLMEAKTVLEAHQRQSDH